MRYKFDTQWFGSMIEVQDYVLTRCQDENGCVWDTASESWKKPQPVVLEIPRPQVPDYPGAYYYTTGDDCRLTLAEAVSRMQANPDRMREKYLRAFDVHGNEIGRLDLGPWADAFDTTPKWHPY